MSGRYGTRSSLNPGGIMRDLFLAWRLFWDPRVPSMLKLLLPLLALVYWISPIDLLPGMPFDDIALLLLAARFFVQMAPTDAVQRAMYGADNGPNQTEDYEEHETIDTTWRVVED